MTRPTITREMIRLYDDYTHRTLDRRRLMRDLARLTGGAAAAYAVLSLLEADETQAAMVAEDDPRLTTATIAYPGAGGEMSGYLARPATAAAKLPAVMVIHENRGLNAYIRDVARRAALEGFLTLAPDFLSPAGGTPPDSDKARQMIGQLDPAATVANAVATVSYLRRHPASTGKVGAVGFCWGGGLTNQTAVHAPELAAAVPFYGRVPAAADVPKIKARMMMHYAGLDDWVNPGIPGYEAALKAAGVDYRMYVYENVDHAFHNDTAGTRYDKAAADLAWSRTVAFLKETLGG